MWKSIFFTAVAVRFAQCEEYWHDPQWRRLCYRQLSCGPYGPPGWTFGDAKDTCVYGNGNRRQHYMFDGRHKFNHTTGNFAIVGLPTEDPPYITIGHEVLPPPQPVYHASIHGVLSVYAHTFRTCVEMQKDTDYPCQLACRATSGEVTILGRPDRVNTTVRAVSLRVNALCGYYIEDLWYTTGGKYVLEIIFSTINVTDTDPINEIHAACSPRVLLSRQPFASRRYYLSPGVLEWSSADCHLFPIFARCLGRTNIMRRKYPWTTLPTIQHDYCYLFCAAFDSSDIDEYGGACRVGYCESAYMCHCPSNVYGLKALEFKERVLRCPSIRHRLSHE